MKPFSLLAWLCLFTTYSTEQIAVPAPSPSAKVIQKIGLGEVEISYTRPSTNGRAISWNLPFGAIWLILANWC